MTTPPRTAKASDARRRSGQETKAAKLRTAGWLVIPPEKVAALPANIRTILWELNRP